MALNDDKEKLSTARQMLFDYPPGSEHHEAAREFLDRREPWQHDEGLENDSRRAIENLVRRVRNPAGIP